LPGVGFAAFDGSVGVLANSGRSNPARPARASKAVRTASGPSADGSVRSVWGSSLAGSFTWRQQ